MPQREKPEKKHTLKARLPNQAMAIFDHIKTAIAGIKDTVRAERLLSLCRRLAPGRRWSAWLAYALILAAMISGGATYLALTASPPFGRDPSTVIWLLNLDLMILLLLVVLIAKRVARIWAGRRKKLPGSRLHVRLVMIFGILAAVPAIIMTVFSAVFFHFGVQSWFSERVKTAVYESQAVAEAYLEEHKQAIRADLLAMANDIDGQAHRFFNNPAALERAVQTQSLLRNFSEAVIFDGTGRIVAKSALSFTLAFESLPRYALLKAKEGELVLIEGESGENGENVGNGGSNSYEDRVRALMKLGNFVDAYLFVGRMVDPDVLSHVDATSGAVEEYSRLEGSYAGLQVTVTMIFVVVALLLLLAAMWLGILLARQIVNPIAALIDTADKVRGGDLTARISEDGRIEEFDFLARSFNLMTGRIKQQRDDLVRANLQLNERRRFTEAVLTGVSAGIVGVDEKGVITILNASAASLFGRREGALIGKSVSELMMPDLSALLEQAHAQSGRGKITQAEIPFRAADGSRRVFLVRIAIERIGEDDRGAVLTFDDITEFLSAQRKAAWADVARRIAHEIKNPLTPIQLSAERLRRKYQGEVRTDPEIFTQCTETIIRHVEDIGQMVSEFSDFARMPDPVLKEENILRDIQSVVALHRQAYRFVTFKLHNALREEEGVFSVCDGRQIRQALTNLIQNAVESIEGAGESGRGASAGVGVSVSAGEDRDEKAGGAVSLLLCQGETPEEIAIAVSDNGPGFPEDTDIFGLSEPYVTFKSRGTGLGLAIVKKIMEDHGGRLLLGQQPWLAGRPGWRDLGGACVVLILPRPASGAGERGDHIEGKAA